MAVKTTKTTKAAKKAAPVKKAETAKAVKAAKPAAKTAAVVKTPAKAASGSLTADVLGTDGKKSGTMHLPASLFGVRVNNQLLAQAIRVYRANQREGSAQVKTRGKVEGSTRKIYKQKGTGKARHGGIRAPIFVGGGIVFGPETRDYTLRMPDKMKRVAFASALTKQFKAGKIVIMDGLESIEPKTKVVAASFAQAGLTGRTLLLIAPEAHKVMRAARNLERVDVMPVAVANTYEVMTHAHVVFMKSAIEALKA